MADLKLSTVYVVDTGNGRFGPAYPSEKRLKAKHPDSVCLPKEIWSETGQGLEGIEQPTTLYTHERVMGRKRTLNQLFFTPEERLNYGHVAVGIDAPFHIHYGEVVLEP